MERFIANKSASASCNIQPYIICVTNGVNYRYFVQGDGWILNRSDNQNIISAFDLLFKLFYVINVEFPTSLVYFFNFIEAEV